MNLLLILAAAFSLALCQIQAFSDPERDLYLTGTRHTLPHTKRILDIPKRVGATAVSSYSILSVIDNIFEKIKELVYGVASLLEKVKKPIDKMGFTNFSELLGGFMKAINKFGDNVGSSASVLPEINSFKKNLASDLRRKSGLPRGSP